MKCAGVLVHLKYKELLVQFNYRLSSNFLTFISKVGSVFSRQAIGVPMGTDCAPLIVDLFFCVQVYEIPNPDGHFCGYEI